VRGGEGGWTVKEPWGEDGKGREGWGSVSSPSSSGVPAFRGLGGRGSHTAGLAMLGAETQVQFTLM